jgi:putative spermidine/putrescine transport system permease protein
MRRHAGLLLILPPLLLIAVFFLAPLLYLFFVSFHAPSQTDLYGDGPTLVNYAQVINDPFYTTIILRTLRTTLILLVLTFVIGYAGAYAIAKLRPRWRILLLVVLLFPLMVTNVVRAYGWVALLGRQGVINTTLISMGFIDRPVGMLYTLDAVVLGLLTILLPFMIISVANTLSAIDPRYYEAAASLGASPLRTFLNVTLPLSSPGVTAGLLLVFLLSLSAYVTVALMGGPRQKMLVSLVYDSVVSFQWPRAAALSFVLLGIALLGSALIQMIMRPQRVTGRGR